MLKCWIHNQTEKKETTKPLKEHPGWPDRKKEFQQNLDILFSPTKADRDWETLTKEREELVKKEGKLKKQLNQLITRILKISEKPVGTFDPNLKKVKGIKELLEKYSVNGLEELVKFVDLAVERGEEGLRMKEEIEEFFKSFSVSNAEELDQKWGKIQDDFEEKIAELEQEIEKLKEGREGEEDNEELIAERDELRRKKGELEQEVLDYNNKLKNKQKEVNNKEKEIERLKKESSQKEISLNQKLSEKNGLITTLNSEIRTLKEKLEQLSEEEEEETKTFQEWLDSGELNEEITEGKWKGQTYAQISESGASEFRNRADNLTEQWTLTDLKEEIKSNDKCVIQ